VTGIRGKTRILTGPNPVKKNNPDKKIPDWLVYWLQNFMGSSVLVFYFTNSCQGLGGYSTVTAVVIPPRAEKSPVILHRLGFDTFTKSSIRRLTTVS